MGSDGPAEVILPARPGRDEAPLTSIVCLICRGFRRGRPEQQQSREKMVVPTTLTKAQLAPRDTPLALYGERSSGIATPMPPMAGAAKLRRLDS